MDRSELRYIRVSGTPYECGIRHGEEASDEIRECVAVYERWFTEFCGLGWPAVRIAADKYRSWLADADAELAREIDGIADGSERDVLDIVALNFRTEIAYGASGILGACECTSLAVPAWSSDDGHVYVAENWDWLAETLPLTVLLDVTSGDEQFLTVTEAGMVGKFGLNSSGLGLCVNLLACNQNQIGAGFHILARKVLRSSSLLAAVWAVTGSQRAGSGNFMIGDATSGEVLDLEWAPSSYSVLTPEHGSLAHANHFIGSIGGARDRVEILSSISPGTFLRQARARRLLEAAGGSVGLKDMKAILADHSSDPEGICRHGGPVGRNKVLGQTNLSVITDLTLGMMHLGYGPACEAEYVDYVAPWNSD